MRYPAFMLIVLALGLLAGGCDRSTPQPPEQWVPVRVDIAGRSDADGGIRYSAVVAPRSQLNLAFKVSGYVNSILQHPAPDGGQHPVTQGEPVRKDQVLATLKDEEYRDKVKAAQAALDSANAAMVKASADFERARALYKTGSMTGSDYDSAQQEYSTAKANVASASAQLDDARLNLSYCRLTTPMDAVVLKRNIEVGTLVAPGTQAFALADTSSVKVNFALPDVMLKQVAVGDKLSVSTRSLPGKTFEGTITSISPMADSQTRVFDVELTLPNPEGVWKDGVVAALAVPDLPDTPVPAISVPINAVVSSRAQTGGYALYTVMQKDGKTLAQLQEVKLGQVRGNRVVVLQGLAAGTQVITTGVNTVRDGALIRVLP